MPKRIGEEEERRRRPLAARTRRAGGPCFASPRHSSSPMLFGIASSSFLDLLAKACRRDRDQF
jgi:hypothetical protein